MKRARRQGGRRGGGPVAAAVAGVLATAVAACGGTGGGSGHTVSPSAASPSGGPPVVAFEDTYAYADGLKVKVTKPKAFTPSGTSIGHKAENSPITFTVALTNSTKRTFEVTGVLVKVTAGDQDARVEQIFDSARGVGNPLAGSLAPGASSKAVFAFDVPAADTGKVDVEVRPDFGVQYNSIHWTGSAR
ncbi:hypothetical protein [Streptomyces sp. NPDC002537]